jgi:hypothetical protein
MLARCGEDAFSAAFDATGAFCIQSVRTEYTQTRASPGARAARSHPPERSLKEGITRVD